ncbi:MAG: ABC transporter permease [Anaerolineae bacterium]|nr:ABC transporter permease [Anaerolineae bacterium]
MTTISKSDTLGRPSAQPWAKITAAVQRQGALIALILLIVFGALRYDGFLGAYNISEFLRYNSMFGFISLGMTFVIMTGGIDLSVGAVAALASVLAAYLTPYGFWPAVIGPIVAGVLIGLFNGWVIAHLRIAPFIATLAMLLGARGAALIMTTTSISIDSSYGFDKINSGSLFGVPTPVIIWVAAFIIGSIVLNYTGFGRYTLALGGNEEATRLMGLPADRIKMGVYALSGGLSALAGVILAARTFTGLPTEGLGWELSAIAAVVVGGTLLTGGMGSVGATLVGVILLGLIFNILNFENGYGLFSLSAYWQSVIRGAFLLIVIILQNRLIRRQEIS